MTAPGHYPAQAFNSSIPKKMLPNVSPNRREWVVLLMALQRRTPQSSSSGGRTS